MSAAMSKWLRWFGTNTYEVSRPSLSSPRTSTRAPIIRFMIFAAREATRPP